MVEILAELTTVYFTHILLHFEFRIA